MHPNCFKYVDIYTKNYDAIFGLITEYKDGCIVERYQVPKITSREELISFHPYQTLQMGHFVRRDKFIGFDEDMDTGEDWKYYLELWKGKCIKIDRPLMINVRGNHSTGPRSASGGEWTQSVMKQIEKARGSTS